MAVNSVQKCSTVNEIEIPEGKVDSICKQWLVHEDTGLAYKLQEEEIEGHLNHNKIRNQIVRSDLMQAKHIQQAEQQIYQQIRKQRQAQLDEQLAKELQLNLIEEEQKQMMEQQRIADEDEKYAKSLHEKEKQKYQRRKLAREQAQIEKIKRERLQYYLDNNLDVTSTMNDDLDELDLSDFCMKPPDDIRGEQLQVFMHEQDEELARFLQIYENQKKHTLIKDKQELQENQDYEIARLIYEEEKAKVLRMKEKRLQKRMKVRQESNQEQTNQPEYYIADNRLYRLPNQTNEQGFDQYLNEELYDEPPQEDNQADDYRCDNSCSENGHMADNLSEETNLKQIDNRSTSSNSLNNSQRGNSSHQIDQQHLRYSAMGHVDAQYTLSTKQLNQHVTNQNVLNFVNRALPPLPTAKFHNFIEDIDPTYHRSKKDKPNSLSDHTLDSSASNESTTQPASSSAQGVHFAQLVRVQDDLQNSQNNDYDLVESQTRNSSNESTDRQFDNDQHQMINQMTGQNYATHNQQMNNINSYLPVQGHRRTPAASNVKKSKKDRNKSDKCRQQ